MNKISKTPLRKLGYDFIPPEYLPAGKDEYYLRMEQNRAEIPYRALKPDEVTLLNLNGNSSDNWNQVMVSDIFLPELVHNCAFFGLVRIGRLEPYFLEFHNLRRPVGLYNSTIISCDIGNNVVIDHVNYLSHYIIGNDVMLVNVNELATTDHAKFGNGILKEGEPESIRIQLEICNENGGRSIIPFDGMLPGDAWLWSRFRDDEALQLRFRQFTEKDFDQRRGYYGTIGDRTVIKNCKIIKDVKIGTDAYLKGANKLKNLTINSSAAAKSQIGEGCELVNGIVGQGCRIFYGVKAVRFILASHSQLKYGARLINSYLGNNATISCCEVLNSLIFPAHEQHHNNSFLCASLLMGQSNMAAGATVGSNHNSRGADGELIAGRGFWPGLCVSIKHNSRFASFIIMAKGDYPSELDIPLPFSLLSNDVSDDELTVMPAYWFLHNMYALARNAWKYADRDKRNEKIQLLEFDYLAPDSIGEVAEAVKILQKLTARAWLHRETISGSGTSSEFSLDRQGESLTVIPSSDTDLIAIGKGLLDKNDPSLTTLEIIGDHFENSSRKVRIRKVTLAYPIYHELIIHYAMSRLVDHIQTRNIIALTELQSSLPDNREPETWINAGGQLLKKSSLNQLIADIHSKKISSWQDIHRFYQSEAENYVRDKLYHALDILNNTLGVSVKTATGGTLKGLLQQSLATAEWMTKGILRSREKDYKNPFRRMVYDTQSEMDQVVGKLDDNGFIKSQFALFEKYKSEIETLIHHWNL
jgi:carbonic anhydrase/acetyltransferase-like protein (isoleucine patch superfamily)